MKIDMFAAGLLLAATVQPAAAAVVPGGYAGAPAPLSQLYPFGNGSPTISQYVLQVAYSASELSGLTSGSTIVSLGFRLDSGIATIASALNYDDFTVQIGRSANAPGSLSSTFALNYGLDTITARTGALTIAGGSFAGGGTVNPFFRLALTSGYTYTGGDLLITFSSKPTGTPASVQLDAFAVGSTISTVAGSSGNGVPPLTGNTGLFNVPVIELVTASDVPEPSAWMLMLAGFGLCGAMLRARPREALLARR